MIITLEQKRKLKKPFNLENYDTFKQSFSWSKAEKKVNWFKKGYLNAGFNCLDKNVLNGKADKKALIWQSDQGKKEAYTFKDLHQKSNQAANFLIKKGLKPKDKIFFFLPRTPLLYYSFLAVVRAGGVAGTLFPAFNTQALLERLQNSQAKIVITSQELKPRLLKIKDQLPRLKEIIVQEEMEVALKKESIDFQCFQTKAQDPAFMLYTSATGHTPVCGIVIPHRAILQQHLSAEWVLDLKENDLYWCTSDPGWVTGVVYQILAPWSLGITQAVFEGRFSAQSWLAFLKKEKITVWYTAPTALRLIRQEINPNKDDFPHLRHLCSVGEALDPATLEWTLKSFGTPTHDTWWQTETGAMMITNLPVLSIKPGSMGKSLPGIEAAIINDQGKELKPKQEGHLAFKPNWPARMTQVWGNPKLYQTYFKKGWYFSGDKAYQDEEGYFFFLGRADEIIKTSGERISPTEIEAILMTHKNVVEAAVIGKPDKTRGQIIKAFLVLKNSIKDEERFFEEIKRHVKDKLAGHAYPREVVIVKKLPKNQSGKILRRVLKARERPAKNITTT